MLACVALSIFVNFSPLMPGGPVRHEWHHHTFCEPRSISPDLMTQAGISECELVANDYLYLLQMAGTLPGSRDVISYRVTCTNQI